METTNDTMYNEKNLTNYNYLSTKSTLAISDTNSSEIKTRNFFYKGELLFAEEDETIEYKNYKMPLDYKYDSNVANDKHTQEITFQLKKQICGFLNRKGGRIYIGINDSKIVIGNHLNSKDRDKTRNELTNLTSDFFPKCRTEKIRVVFVPVRNKISDRHINNLYVIKIIIKQGEVNRLYSTTSRGFRSFMRLPGQCVELSAEEIEKNLVTRMSGENIFKKVDPEEFEDIEPHIPITSDSEEPIIPKNNLVNLRVISSNTDLGLNRNLTYSLPIDNDKVVDLTKNNLDMEYQKDLKFLIPKYAQSNRTNSQNLSKKENENESTELNYQEKLMKMKRSEHSPNFRKSFSNTYPIKISISNLRCDATKDNIVDLLKNFNFDSSVPIIIKRFNTYDYSCAFVHFLSKVEAIQVKQLLDGTEINNRILQVKIL